MCVLRQAYTSGVAVRGEGGVAGEGRVVGVPKFHSWGKSTTPPTTINSDWMSKDYTAYIIYKVLYFTSCGVITQKI